MTEQPTTDGVAGEISEQGDVQERKSVESTHRPLDDVVIETGENKMEDEKKDEGVEFGNYFVRTLPMKHDSGQILMILTTETLVQRLCQATRSSSPLDWIHQCDWSRSSTTSHDVSIWRACKSV
jgi:hypothetical protein